MVKCFSFIAAMDWRYRRLFSRAGLREGDKDLGDGTVMHCWVPKNREPARPDLVLVHGLGSNAMWQWNEFLPLLVPRFNVYVPDLVFFGGSYSTRPDRSEQFQARCVAALMDALGVSRMSVAGISYGGFVAYSLAAQFPQRVERVVLCGSGVSMEDKDMEEGGALQGRERGRGGETSLPDVARQGEEHAEVGVPQAPQGNAVLRRPGFHR